MPPYKLGIFDVRFDYRMVSFSVLAALATGFPVRPPAVAPLGEGGCGAALRDAGRAHSGATDVADARHLVAMQVALSVVLVAATGLARAQPRERRAGGPASTPNASRVIGTNLFRAASHRKIRASSPSKILERIGALPGVGASRLTTRLPLSNGSRPRRSSKGTSLPTGANAIEFPVASREPRLFRRRWEYRCSRAAEFFGRRFAGIARRRDRARNRGRGCSSGASGRPPLRGQDSPDLWREVVGVVADVEGTDGLQEQPTP